MAELTDEAIQTALADEATPKALRDWATSLQRDLETAKQETATIKREAAFTKAGLKDLPHRSLFEKSYEGELTAEAIQEAAKEYGLVPDAANTTTTTSPQDRSELDAIRRTQVAASTSTSTNGDDDLVSVLDRTSDPREVLRLIETRGSELGVGLPESAGGYRVV